MCARSLLALAVLLVPGGVAAQQARRVTGALRVVHTQPAPVSTAAVTTDIRIAFDRPVALASVDESSLRVFGSHSGAARGSFQLAFFGRVVVFTPDHDFSAGEMVWVNLASSIRGIDGSSLRSAGHAFQFGTAVRPSSGTFSQYAVLSNTTGPQTRIYGASATDLDHDGYLDLTTVNEVSADLRVFLNLADGTGNYGAFLAPEPIGVEASPNEPADFDNDGDADLCVAASTTEDVWILLGNGDGTFGTPQSIPVGQQPHGIVALDVDGDADFDVVNCNRLSDDLSLMLNDGAGVLGAPVFFDGGVGGEYGLAAGDMDGDGVTDLVVGGRNGEHVRTLRGNGNGTFTPAAAAQGCGGRNWVVVLGDVDADGDLDVASANSSSNTAGILKNVGTGAFGAVVTVNLGAHTPSNDLGDLDGDGDLDWGVSCFGAGLWRFYRNDGSGSFASWFDVTAPANPSCSILLDADNDGDLDLALTDEIADVVVLMKNL